MVQFLSLSQLDKISDYSEILKQAVTLKTEISKTQNFLVQFGLNANFKNVCSETKKLENSAITTREKARLYYLLLKVDLIELLLIVSEYQLTQIYKGFQHNPALFNRLIQGARITPGNRPEIIKNLNLYFAFKPEQQPAGFAINNFKKFTLKN